MAKSEKTREKVQSPVQIAVLFEGTRLDGDSSSNVGRLARALVRDERQHVILKNGSGTYHFTHIGGRIAGTDAMRILSDAYTQLARVCVAHVGEPPRVFLFGFSRGALEAVRRKIDPKRLHRSVRKILSRILDQDGNPAPPEIFRDAPTA